MSGRMMNLRPYLTGSTEFTITIDNKLVAQEMRTMQPRIEAYLRTQMQNNHISMRIILEESQLMNSQ